MNFQILFKDINGSDINLGDRVCAYAQDYDEVDRQYLHGVLVVELDSTKPKPIKDIPLFIGKVRFNEEELYVEVLIEKMMVEWENPPCSVRMGGGFYVYELMS